jgi:hypothetical protein
VIISREITKYARGRRARIHSVWRKIASSSNPGFVVVLALCAFAAASFVLGFVFLPSQSAPAEVPNPPELNLSFGLGSPRNLSIYSFLEQGDAQPTELVLNVTGIFASNQSTVHWSLGILGFTGHLCLHPSTKSSLVPLKGFPGDYEISGSSDIPVTSGQPFLVIKLCWNNGAPLITNGSYVSAALSPILAAPGQSGIVIRSLELNGTSLSGYSLSGGIAPTAVTARSWIWTDSLSSSFQSQARAEIPIIASSLPGIQRDNQAIFFSGILFGVAGGAAVSIIPALLDAFDRRKAKDKYKTTAGSRHPCNQSGQEANQATQKSLDDGSLSAKPN